MFHEMATQAIGLNVDGFASNYEEAVVRLNHIIARLNCEVGADETMSHTVAELLCDVIVTARAGVAVLDQAHTESNEDAITRLEQGMKAVATVNASCQALACSVSLDKSGCYVITVQETGSNNVFVKCKGVKLTDAVSECFGFIDEACRNFNFKNPFSVEQ